MGSNLNVSITADVVDLQQKFATARAETNALSAEMGKLAKAAAAGTLDAAGQSQFAQISEDYLKAKGSAAAYSTQLRETTDATKNLGSSIEDARGQLSTLFQVTGAAAALEAIRGVADGVLKLGERASDIGSMADVLGVTTAQFQAMGAAAEEAGSSDEAFYRAAEKIKTTLTEAHDGSGPAIASLRELGLSAQQANDRTFGLIPTLKIIHDRLNDSSTSTMEMNELTRVLGGRAALAAEAMKAFDGSAASVALIMERINGISDEQTKRLAGMATWWKELGTSVANTAGKMLIAITDAMEAQNNLGETDSFADMRASAQASAAAVVSAAKTEQAAQTQAAQAAAQAAADAQKKATLAALQSEQAQVEMATSGTAQRVALAQKFYEDTRKFYGNDNVAEVRSAYREMSSAQKEYSTQQRSEFDRQLTEFQETMNQQVSAFKKSRQQIDQAAKESATIVAQNTTTDIAIARMSLEAKKQTLEADVANTTMASAQKFQILKDLATQEEQADEQEVQAQMASLDKGTAAYNAACNKIRELRARLALDLAQYDNQAAAAAKRAADQDATGWKNAVGEIESAEGSLIGDLISKRQSLAQDLLQITSRMLQQELTNDAKALTTRLLLNQEGTAAQKALEQGGLLYHLATELQKTGDTTAQETARTAAATSAAATRTSATASAAAAQQAIAAATGSQTVMADAAKAYAGTFASVAQIPYVGYLIAPGVAAAAFAEVASMAGMASLDTGTAYVPQDMTARIHKGEAVLPKPMAETLRQNFSGGSDQSGGGDTHYHTHNWSAFDGHSVRSLIRSSSFQKEFASAMRAHYNSGGRG